MFADEIRRAAEAAPRQNLPEVASLLWRAYAAGSVTEAEAEALSALIEARKTIPAPPAAPARRVGSRPRTDASLERRRKAAMSGEVPERIRAAATPGESACLVVIGREVRRAGECRLCMDAIAALAGVCKTIAKRAVRLARDAGLILVERRTLGHRRNDSNVIRIIAPDWLAVLRLGRAQSAKAAQAVIVASLNGGTFVPPSDSRKRQKGFRGEPRGDRTGRYAPGSTERPRGGFGGSAGGIA